MLASKPNVHHSIKDKNKDGRTKGGLGWSLRHLQGQQMTVCSWKELFFFFFDFLPFSRAAPSAYGGSQARGRIGAVGTGLRQSHSNAGSKPRLQPAP